MHQPYDEPEDDEDAFWYQKKPKNQDEDADFYRNTQNQLNTGGYNPQY